MIIGLVRHFKVAHPYVTRQRMNSQEFRDWVRAYDEADVRANPCNLREILWDSCYASDLTRAVITARTLFTGSINITPLLREIYIDPLLDTQIRLPFRFWDSGGRLAWYFSHSSQQEPRPQVQTRVRTLIGQVLADVDRNVLIVSHGGLMYFLRRELEKEGFRGEKFTKAENGRLYCLERKES